MGRRPKDPTTISKSTPAPLPTDTAAPPETVTPIAGEPTGATIAASPADSGPDISNLRAEAREEKERRRNKRRKKSGAPEPEVIDPKQAEYIAGFAMFGSMALELICARMPNPIPPTATEKEAWNGAFDLMAKKYIPMAGEYAPELSFGLAAAFILIPRAKKDVGPDMVGKVIEIPGSVAPQVIELADPAATPA